MKTSPTVKIALALCMIVSTSCKREFQQNSVPQVPLETPKVLNEKEKETVVKFQHASDVLQALFSADQDLRKEFNGFIKAKLDKSGTDEELTFKEIFQAKQLNLTGVKSDFLTRFRNAFANIFIKGNYANAEKYSSASFNTVEDIAAYYDQPKLNHKMRASGIQSNTSDILSQSVPYEIYFPYSENWNPDAAINYAITYNPLTTDAWNYGMFYNAAGIPLYEVTVNDDYAFGIPTYIITYDDGLKMEDFQNGQTPIASGNYKVNLTDDEYNPSIVQVNTITPEPFTCTKELRVKDGRWTQLNNGYGLFEGKIEFAVAVTMQVSSVTIPNENPASNPIIDIERVAHAWGYQKIKRNTVRRMKKHENEFISFGIYVSPWCSGQPDKMIFLYEYDKPNTFSSNAAKWTGALSAAVLLIPDPATKLAATALLNNGLAPLVTAWLEGTAKSKIEHYSILGSEAVSANQRIPTAGSSPSLLNGFRPYGTNNAMISLVID
jgi:hypothetical protein